MTWEIDEFHGENTGLVVAEIELQHEMQTIEKPEWIGEEVTNDKRYYNACLVSAPYTTWTKPQHS
jgi:CYTH domain-containing protein